MITHNLGIIAELCQKVAIMYGGEIVEYGTVQEVFENPKHWYTYGLLHAIPKLTGERSLWSPFRVRWRIPRICRQGVNFTLAVPIVRNGAKRRFLGL